MKKLLSGWLILSFALLVGCAAGGPPPAVGAWTVQIASPLGDLAGTLTINEDGSGSMSADGLGDTAFDGIVFDGNAVSFTGSFDVQGQSVTVDFTGTIEGDALNGEFGTDFGPLAITGTRN